MTLAALAAAAVAVAAPSAMAQGEETATLEKGGATKLTLGKAAKKVLREAGTKVSGKSFAIIGGTIDPVDADPADIDHNGKLKFQAGQDKVVFKNLTLLLGGKDRLIGKVGARTVTIANLSGGKIARQGFESTDVTGLKATLSKAAANALNKALETHEFAKGQNLGKVSVDAQLAEVLIAATGSTDLQSSADFAQKLASQGIAATPIAPATTSVGTGGLPKFSFPIAGGKGKTDLSEVSVAHTGGLLLSKGSVELPFAEPGVELTTPPVLTVSLGGARAAAADLDLSGMTKTPTAAGLDVAGIVVKFNAGSAAILNSSFNTTAFAAGDVVGTASTSITFK